MPVVLTMHRIVCLTPFGTVAEISAFASAFASAFTSTFTSTFIRGMVAQRRVIDLNGGDVIGSHELAENQGDRRRCR